MEHSVQEESHRKLKPWEIRYRPYVDKPCEDPDDTMIGFVPVLPAMRQLVHIGNDQLAYETCYEANYYALRDAIERDQLDRRGGYRKPYTDSVSLYALYVVSYDEPPLCSPYLSRFDLDNCDKTFIDALATTSRMYEGRRLRHIEDDSLIKRHASAKRPAEDGELCGVWYALKKTDEHVPFSVELNELEELVAREHGRREERASFNEMNLRAAEEDCLHFLLRVDHAAIAEVRRSNLRMRPMNRNTKKSKLPRMRNGMPLL